MVDDQPAKLLTYEAILSGLDLNCVRALSGEEALAKLLSQEFAVILLDVNMPGMDGFEVARLIREHPRLEKTPIIFVSAVYRSELDQLRGYEVGAIDYISVPAVPEVLRSKVAILVELHLRRAELQEVNRALASAREHLVEDHARVLQETREQLNAIFEHPSEAIVVMQALRDGSGAVCDWVYRNANSNALQLLGLTREKLIGRRLTEIVPDRAEYGVSLCTRVLETGEKTRYETQYGQTHCFVTIFPMGRDCVVCAGVDITERKTVEAALRESERRYRALIENAPVAVAHNALNGRFQYVNAAFCRLVGYTAEELYSRTWQQITHPDDVGGDQSLADRVVAKELSGYTLEKRYIRKDGSCVWASLFGNFVPDDKGDAMQGVAAVIDITERRNADRALRESEQRLLLAKRAARLGTYDYGVQNKSFQWDERTRELWGLAPDEPVTYPVFLAGIHPEDWPSTRAAIDRSLDPSGDGRYLATYRVINRQDGMTRWIEATGQALFEEGRAIRLVGTVQDVSARTIADAKLRESEERIREIANHIDQFAWTWNEKGEATWYNDRWYEYTGSSFEDMRGDGWKVAHHPDHLPRVIDNLQECIARGVPWEDTFPLQSKDGQFPWFLCRAVPIRDEQGRVRRWFGTATDVTDLRQLQDALREADRRKDHFLAMLAHELRNPVAPITSAAEALTHMLGEDDKARQLGGIIRRQAHNLSRLLDDLLDVARITQGRIQLKLEVAPLETCISLALESSQPLIREKRHQLTIGQSPQPLFVDADPVRLAQCLDNLLTNAAKYTDAGGEIRIRPYVDGAEAVVEVSDNGQGISSEFLPHIFELFAQNDRALDRAQGGLGIGLSVCKQLIEMQGGTVSGDSAGPGRGATFALRIPLANRAPQLSTSAEVAAEAQRILIVDDNRDAADSLALLLQFEGHEVATAYSAESALERLRDFIPQLALLDIGLPAMDGYDLAVRLRQAGIPALRLIALSGYGQAADRARSQQAGFDAHLLKPVAIDDLKRVISGDLTQL